MPILIQVPFHHLSGTVQAALPSKACTLHCTLHHKVIDMECHWQHAPMTQCQKMTAISSNRTPTMLSHQNDKEVSEVGQHVWQLWDNPVSSDETVYGSGWSVYEQYLHLLAHTHPPTMAERLATPMYVCINNSDGMWERIFWIPRYSNVDVRVMRHKTHCTTYIKLYMYTFGQ